MMDKTAILDALRSAGRNDAQAFRARAINDNLSGTAIIAEEQKVPAWRQGVYSEIGAPVRHKGQVYKLWQAHDSTGHDDWSPDKAVSLWDICHTTDPGKAKTYIPPQGSRGLYQVGECMRWTDGQIYRSIIDNNAHTPEAYPQGWEAVTE